MSIRVYPNPLLTRTLAPPGRIATAGEVLRVWLSLTKPRIVSLVVFTAVVACVMAARGAPPLATLLILIVAGSLAAAGAAVLNHYVDRDIDRRMARTRTRPLASGRIGRPWLALPVGLLMIVAGVVLAAWVNLALSGYTLAGAVIYAGVYTLWLKRRTPLNIVVGGGAGSAAVLGGWAAVEPTLGLAPWLLAGLVFVWTPAHFWSLALARQADYASAHVPMLPVLVGPVRTAWWTGLHILATVGLSVWLGLAAGLGGIYVTLAAVAGLGFVSTGVMLLRRPDPATGWRVFKWSGPYLGLVFLGVLVDTLVSRLH